VRARDSFAGRHTPCATRARPCAAASIPRARRWSGRSSPFVRSAPACDRLSGDRLVVVAHRGVLVPLPDPGLEPFFLHRPNHAFAGDTRLVMHARTTVCSKCSQQSGPINDGSAIRASTASARPGGYLAAVLDLFSRFVVGWAVSAVNDRHLTIRALDMASKRRCPQAGLLHHSDRGSIYASDDYRAVLTAHGIPAP